MTMIEARIQCEAALQELEKLFQPHCKVTLLIRNPQDQDRHILITSDEIDKIQQAVLYLREKQCSRWDISDHALQQFMKRSGSASRDRAIKTLKRLLLKAEPVEMKRKYAALALINHGFQEAEYFESGGWIMVVVEGKTLVTVHNGQAGRWQKKK